MFPPSPYAGSVGSFQNPVNRPSAGPLEAPFVSVQINCEWIPFIVGALKQLLLQATWRYDTVDELQRVQGQAFDLIALFNTALCGQSEPQKGEAGAEIENMIRQSPDNPCLLQTSIDGVNWCTFADLSKCMNFGTQPGPDSPQPAPLGGSQQYCAVLQANGKLNIPTTVSSGDTIELSMTGAGNDGTDLIWYCENGQVFFLGNCNGSTVTHSGDPVNTAPHMSPIVYIGSTPYQISPRGVAFTVPSGHTNDQVVLQINDDTLSNNSGSYNVCATVTNNQTTTWTHTFNFPISDGGWTPADNGHGPLAIWVSGDGWDSTIDVDAANTTANGIVRMFPARTIKTVEVLYQASADAGSGGAREVLFGTGGSLSLYGSLNTGSGSFDTPIVNSQAGVTTLRIQVDRNGAPDTTTRITKVIVTGIGSDPF